MPRPGQLTPRLRINLALPELDYQIGVAMAAERDVSFTEMIRGAIATERYLRDAKNEGKRIFIEDRDGRTQEIIFFR